MKVADLSSKEEIAIFENAKRDVELAGIELKNSLEVVDVVMDPPSLDDTMPDNERLTRALRKYLNISRVRIPYAVLKKLPDVLRESNFSVKCVIRATSDDMFVYDIFGKDEDVVMTSTPNCRFSGDVIIDIDGISEHNFEAGSDLLLCIKSNDNIFFTAKLKSKET